MTNPIAKWLPRIAAMSADELDAVDALARADAERRERSDAEARHQREMAALAETGLPRKPTRWLETPAIVALRAWDGDSEAFPVAVLYGGRGCGKSLAALWWLANPDSRRSSGKHPVQWIKAERWASLSKFDVGELDRYRRARRLVVDEIGGERLSPGGHELGRMADLLDERMEYADRVTVMTTNASPDVLRQHYAAEKRIISRLERPVYLNVHGPDLRRVEARR